MQLTRQRIIESHAVDEMLFEEPDDHHSLSKVMEKLDAANYKLSKIIKDDEGGTSTDAVFDPSLSVAADHTSTKTKTNTAMMVGFEEDALKLKHRLTSPKSAR